MDALEIAAIASQQERALGREKGTKRRVCVISLAGELFAIDLRQVGEVFEVGPITPVPDMPDLLVGVTNLRGVIVPLVDLRPLLGLSIDGPVPPYAVVIRHDGQQIGVLVDQMPEIHSVGTDDVFTAPPGGSQGFRPFVSSLLRIEGRVGGVVEVSTLLASVASR